VAEWMSSVDRETDQPTHSLSTMSWVLRRRGGDSITIDHEVSIGRDATCTIRLQAAAVSRIHCRLIPKLDHVVLVDEGRNGTFVNGIRVGKVSNIRASDTIEIDADHFRLEQVETAAQQKVTQNIARVRARSAPPSPPTLVPPHAQGAQEADPNAPTTEIVAARVRPKSDHDS
jgi:pSer/pThr/pTyr-binding forkhead associated (FHA) protein